MPLSHIQSTPIAKIRSTVRFRNTFAAGHISIGAQFATLIQFRAAAVEDMAHKAVRVDANTFADMFFPLPNSVTVDDHPAWPENVFDELSKGNELLEIDIQQRFVSFLVPSLLATC